MITTKFKFVLLIALFFFAGQSYAESNFVRVNLTRGLSVSLPKNWSVQSDNGRITLSAWIESVLDAKKLTDVENALPFTANYYDDRGNTAGTFAIRFYPTIKITQAEAIAEGAGFITDLDAGVRQNFTKSYEAAGGKSVDWLGTTKKTINGSVYFISENRQLSQRGVVFHGVLVRYLNAGKSFTIIISYREDQAYFLRPIYDKIISSIRI